MFLYLNIAEVSGKRSICKQTIYNICLMMILFLLGKRKFAVNTNRQVSEIIANVQTVELKLLTSNKKNV